MHSKMIGFGAFCRFVEEAVSAVTSIRHTEARPMTLALALCTYIVSLPLFLSALLHPPSGSSSGLQPRSKVRARGLQAI